MLENSLLYCIAKRKQLVVNYKPNYQGTVFVHSIWFLFMVKMHAFKLSTQSPTRIAKCRPFCCEELISLG